MTSLVWLVVITGAARGYGDAIARALRLQFGDRAERATLTIGLGAGLLVVATFVLGLLHLVGRASALVLVLPGAAFAGWSLARSPRVGGVPAKPRWLYLGLRLALAICMAANLLGTLAPPSFVDAIFYHLFIPKTYVQAGGIVELPAIWQSYQPLGVEMLFTVGFALQGGLLAALTHTGLGILAAGASFVLGRRIAGPLAGLLAAAIFYCNAMIAWESTSCFVELGITAFSTLGFYAVLRWSDEEDPRWLIVAALLMGFSGTCKLTAIQFPLIASALVGWTSWRRGRTLGAIAGRVAVSIGIPLVFCVPWYIHSYLWTGNPVYPFAARIFGPNPDYNDTWFILSHYGPGHGIRDLLLLPWRLLSSGALFECGQFLSPLPIIVGPLILLRLKGSRDRQLLGAAIAIGFGLWLASAHIARYLIPLQSLAAALTADALLGLAAGCRYRLRLAVVTAALFIGFGTVSTLLLFSTVAPVVLGRENTVSYLDRTAVFYPAYRMVMADVSPNALILTNQGATYYLDRPHVRERDSAFVGGPDSVSKLLARAHYTHIFIHGQVGVEEAVAALGPRVKLLWHRELEMPLSRAFGRKVKVSAALFEVVY